MQKKWIALIGILFTILILSACSSDRGMSQEIRITADDVPPEPTQDELTSSIQGSPSNQIDAIIAASFPLMDTVSDDSGTTSKIYATTEFNLEELAKVITSTIEPDETSEVVDEQQIFIYPDYFVTLKPSEDDADVLLIEVASEAFVKRNYAPSFLSTYFTIRMLDSLLGNNWSSNRTQACQTGGCYGGYTGKPSGASTGTRGRSTFRGGGPGAGK
ncbi:DUF4247 domain-containing protein [Oceanobacillus rekensis]|uniref:DUF4247 domain-containing protein n=1 Tax=Oceanobacillus rekensis TaxID=937927 RepID=UPI000B451A7F|nr:DUF4247 domain-containing protein [Oceanobacillus rekensis]